jgi:hypothetical protein
MQIALVDLSLNRSVRFLFEVKQLLCCILQVKFVMIWRFEEDLEVLFIPDGYHISIGVGIMKLVVFIRVEFK